MTLYVAFKRLKRYHIMRYWAISVIWMLKHICKLDYSVHGLENLPKEPSIIFTKHQSAWETIAMQLFLPPHVWVMKQELLWIPFFGWGMASLRPIAIDRSSEKKALSQLINQGKERLNEKTWIIIFPEGTRVAPGSKLKHKASGAIIANKTSTQVVPIAHNAGLFWPKDSFLKHPGTVQLHICKAISTDNKSTEEINTEAEAWIESTADRLLNH